MLGAGVVVEAYAEPGALRGGEAAVGGVDGGRLVDEIAHPRVGEVVEMLQDLVVGGGHGELEVGRGADRAADVVWRHHQVIGVGPAGQPLHRQEATEVGQVRLDHVDQAAGDQLVELRQGVHPLAGGDRQSGGGADG